MGVASPAPSSGGSTVDDLAPFATLNTDEEREQKATTSPPGTFNVIVNPNSFQHLTEYASDTESETKRQDQTALRRGSIAASLASSLGRDSGTEGIALPHDPNTIILQRFEDLSRRTTREVKSPAPSTTATRPIIKREPSDTALQARTTETSILRHFRDTVWKRLVPPERGQDSSIALLDDAAAQFPPVSYFGRL